MKADIVEEILNAGHEQLDEEYKTPTPTPPFIVMRKHTDTARDGGTRVFPVLNSKIAGIDHIYQDFRGQEPNPNFDPAAKAALDDFNAFRSAFTYEVYKFIFGDHVRVTITKDSIRVEHCDHE